jgi:hypothetical protein
MRNIKKLRLILGGLVTVSSIILLIDIHHFVYGNVTPCSGEPSAMCTESVFDAVFHNSVSFVLVPFILVCIVTLLSLKYKQIFRAVRLALTILFPLFSLYFWLFLLDASVEVYTALGILLIGLTWVKYFNREEQTRVFLLRSLLLLLASWAIILAFAGGVGSSWGVGV